MKILSNKEYDKLINDKTPTIEYYMNNPYQARKIEKLEDYNIELEIKIDKKDKEIERLSNIINELEKWLVEWREMLDCPDFYEEGIIYCINDTLNKLQELKGSDKE